MSEEKIQEWGWDEFEESMQPETESGFVKKQDHLRILQSECQARLEAETKLRELQDAENILSIYSFDGIAGIHTDEESDMHDEALKLHEAAIKESRDRAIQESRIRNKTMIQRYNHTKDGFVPSSNGDWYRKQDVELYLPTNSQPLSIKLLFGWVILFTIAAGLTLWFVDSRMDKFENELKRADYSKEFCKGY